jgi:hypothetical protein
LDARRSSPLKRRDAGEAMREIARSYNVSHSTISTLSPWRLGRGTACRLRESCAVH